MGKAGNVKALYKRHILHIHPGMKKHSKNRVICKCTLQSHAFYFLIGITGSSHYFHFAYMKIRKEKNKACQQNCSQGTKNHFLMFFVNQILFE